MIRTVLGLIGICVATTAAAQSLRLPDTAAATLQTDAHPDTLLIAIAPWDGAAQPHVTVDGLLTRSAWKIVETGRSTLDIMQTLQDQLQADGLAEIFSCQDIRCGGFDFRFSLDLLPPPAMQVNLGDFQYWAGASAEDHAAILVSKIADTAFIQIDRIGEDEAPAPVPTARPSIGTRTTPGGLTASLSVDGHAVLDDLTFATGSSTLDAGRYASLATLAAYLQDNPTMRVALVGHTDTSGALDANIALSKRRAQSVVARLVDIYGVSRSQITAEGMGYLSPIASNLSETGREANRRVEVIVIDEGG